MSFKILLLPRTLMRRGRRRSGRPSLALSTFENPHDAHTDIADADAPTARCRPALRPRQALRWIYCRLCWPRRRLDHMTRWCRVSWSRTCAAAITSTLHARRRLPARLRPPLRFLPAAEALAARADNPPAGHDRAHCQRRRLRSRGE